MHISTYTYTDYICVYKCAEIADIGRNGSARRTVFEADGGVLDAEEVENTFVTYLVLGD